MSTQARDATPDPGQPDALLAAMLEQLSDHAVVGLAPDGTVVTWNTGAVHVLGHADRDAVGRDFEFSWTETDRRAGLPTQLLEQARREGRAAHSGWRVRRDGSRFWADVVVTALDELAGGPVGFVEVTRDLSEQHDLEVRVRDSEERHRFLVGQVIDYAIIALDTDGVVLTWNLGAERMKGHTRDQAIGRSFSMFYSPVDQRAGVPAQLLEEARTHGRVQSTGWRVRRDGSRFWADVTITALHDDTGRLTGYAKVTRDRTDVKRLEEAQDAFYASFSHDFRTPVTVIKGFVETLREAGDDAELRDELLGRIEAGADRLLSMVQGLVDFAQQRVAHADLQLADIDVAEVARRAVNALHPRAVETRVEVEAGVVALARANGEAMTRIVTNLVMNALKYSGPTSTVRLAFARREGLVELSVTDEGRGIHADDLATIFEQFERGRLATDDGGSGLGLASVRDLVEQQGGSVSIRSKVDVGTRVSVLLPATLDGAPTPVAASPAKA